MHQGELAFHETLLLLKLLDFLPFESFKQLDVYAPHQAHTSIQQKIRKNYQTVTPEQNRGEKLIYTSR
jgi:hypothetical protein